MEIELMADERIDEVNEQLKLIQKKDGLTFGTDAYLLASYISPSRKGRAVELGAGTGIISLLLAARERFAQIKAIEIQSEFSDMAKRNISLNSLDEKIDIISADVRDVNAQTVGGEADVVFANPPYMRTDSGKRNESDKKYIARHEVFGNIADFCSAAKRLLKHGGKFYCVWRPDRLSDLLFAMKSNDITPKTMTLVYADKDSEPSMALVSGKLYGKDGMIISKPLFMYSDTAKKEMSDDAKSIYETMSFDGLSIRR